MHRWHLHLRCALLVLMAAGEFLLVCILVYCAHLSTRRIDASGELQAVQGAEKMRHLDVWRISFTLSAEDARWLRSPRSAAGELDVDVLLVTAPTRPFRGKLAVPKNAEDVLTVRLHPIDGDIPNEKRLPEDLLFHHVPASLRIHR